MLKLRLRQSLKIRRNSWQDRRSYYANHTNTMLPWLRHIVIRQWLDRGERCSADKRKKKERKKKSLASTPACPGCTAFPHTVARFLCAAHCSHADYHYPPHIPSSYSRLYFKAAWNPLHAWRHNVLRGKCYLSSSTCIRPHRCPQ